MKPSANVRCCYNCKHWHRRRYIHCQCSGPRGGDIKGDPRCTFALIEGLERALRFVEHGALQEYSDRIRAEIERLKDGCAPRS